MVYVFLNISSLSLFDLSLYFTYKVESAGCSVPAVGVNVTENSYTLNTYILNDKIKQLNNKIHNNENHGNMVVLSTQSPSIS